MRSRAAPIFVLLLAGCISEINAAPGIGRGRRFIRGSGTAVATEGTAARTWQHSYTFADCATSPDYNTITDGIGSMDLTESVQTTYTCNVSTTGLDETSIGITANTAMNVDGACWNTGAGGFPEIPDGQDLLVRVIGMDNLGQGGNRRLVSTQLNGNELWYLQRNSLERNAFVFRDNATTTTLVFTTNGVIGQWQTWDLVFKDATDTLWNCRDTDCISAVITDPASMPARIIGLFDGFNCGGTNLIDDTDIAGVWISYCSSGCAASEWTTTTHGDDCAADGTC